MVAPQPPAQKTTSRRMTVLLALLAVIIVLAVWLSNCIPGFGLGSSGRSQGEPATADKAEPTTPEPAKPEISPPQVAAAGKTLNVKIDVAGCAVAGFEPVDCSKVCERAEPFEGMDDAVLEVTGASHGDVLAMTDCLKAKGIDKVAIRRETP